MTNVAPTFKLCYLADLKTFLDMHGTPVMDTNKYDGMLTLLIQQVSDLINQFCGRTFEYAAQVEYYDGDGRRDFFYVKVPPVDTEVTVQIWDDIDRVYAAADELDSADFVVYPDTGKMVYEDGTFNRGNRNVKISYTGGYKQSTLPDRLKFACMEQCAFVFRNRQRPGITAQTDEMGSLTKTIPDFRLMDSVKSALMPYRRVVFG
jgi:hypothetical protein